MKTKTKTSNENWINSYLYLINATEDGHELPTVRRRLRL